MKFFDPAQTKDYLTFQATQRSSFRPLTVTTALNYQTRKRHTAPIAIMIVLSSTLIVCILIIALSEPAQAQAVYIPGPNDAHVYTAAVANFPLATASPKETEVSLFMPIKKVDCSSECDELYMPLETARNSDAQFFSKTSGGVFERMKFKVCCSGSRTIDASGSPLVFMEPQVGTSRFMYSTLARFMSANGMAVVLIDHPHDHRNSSASLDPFTDLKAWDESVTSNVKGRIQNINTVLNKLSDAAFLQRQFPDFKFNGTFDTESYSVVGHGIGGSTATTVSVLNPRVRFSINLSGSAPLLTNPTYATIYFFGRSDFRRNNDIHWSATWKQLAGRVTEWDFNNAGIFDFSDLPFIVDLARNDGKITIDGVKGLRDSLGPFGFHVNACYLEAYLKAELTEPKYGYVGDCYRLFDQMQPYPGGVQ